MFLILRTCWNILARLYGLVWIVKYTWMLWRYVFPLIKSFVILNWCVFLFRVLILIGNINPINLNRLEPTRPIDCRVGLDIFLDDWFKFFINPLNWVVSFFISNPTDPTRVHPCLDCPNLNPRSFHSNTRIFEVRV